MYSLLMLTRWSHKIIMVDPFSRFITPSWKWVRIVWPIPLTVPDSNCPFLQTWNSFRKCLMRCSNEQKLMRLPCSVTSTDTWNLYLGVKWDGDCLAFRGSADNGLHFGEVYMARFSSTIDNDKIARTSLANAVKDISNINKEIRMIELKEFKKAEQVRQSNHVKV